jgi:S-adenosylmethionine hydrolase
MSSRKPTAPGATRSPKQTTAPEQTPASTKKYNFTKTQNQKLRSCSRLEIVDKGLEVVVNALDELPDSSQKQIIAKTLLKMQTLLDKELEVKRFEAAQSQRFTNALSGDSTVLCNNVGFNSIAVLLQVLNHEDKDAKVRHVLAAVQANMTMASVLPDDKMDAARNKVW